MRYFVGVMTATGGDFKFKLKDRVKFFKDFFLTYYVVTTLTYNFFFHITIIGSVNVFPRSWAGRRDYPSRKKNVCKQTAQKYKTKLFFFSSSSSL